MRAWCAPVSACTCKLELGRSRRSGVKMVGWCETTMAIRETVFPNAAKNKERTVRPAIAIAIARVQIVYSSFSSLPFRSRCFIIYVFTKSKREYYNASFIEMRECIIQLFFFVSKYTHVFDKFKLKFSNLLIKIDNLK